MWYVLALARSAAWDRSLRRRSSKKGFASGICDISRSRVRRDSEVAMMVWRCELLVLFSHFTSAVSAGMSTGPSDSATPTPPIKPAAEKDSPRGWRTLVKSVYWYESRLRLAGVDADALADTGAGTAVVGAPCMACGCPLMLATFAGGAELGDGGWAEGALLEGTKAE